MNKLILKTAVRSLFIVTSRNRALNQTKRLFNDYMELADGLSREVGMRSVTAPHSIFGDFDAHKWNCMFSFHLSLHYKQAQHVVRTALVELSL
jgi:hypothetical protein